VAAGAGSGTAENAKLTGAVTPDAKVSWSAEDDPEREGFEILLARDDRSTLAGLCFCGFAGRNGFEGRLHGQSFLCGARGGQEWRPVDCLRPWK